MQCHFDPLLVVWLNFVNKPEQNLSIFFLKISFTLYPAHSRVGRGNPVKHTPFPTFCRILEVLRVKWQNLMQRFILTPEQRNGNINLSKYFISSGGDRTHNQSILQSHFEPLRHDWPRILLYYIKYIKKRTRFKSR